MRLDHRARAVQAAACRRRRTEAPFVFTGTHYLTSDGSAGSYAEAATNAAARLFLPGSTLGTATFVCWVRKTVTTTHSLLTVHEGTGAPRIQRVFTTAGSGTLSAAALDDASSTLSADQASIGSVFDGVAWVLVAIGVTTDTSDRIKSAVAGSVSANSVAARAYASRDRFRLFIGTSTTPRMVGDIRSPGILPRYSSDLELAALHTLGPTHDLRVASGDYLGDVAHWWPADGDTGATVTDRGVVGGCNLNLNGNVTIAEVA